MGAELSKMLTLHIGQTGETHKTTAYEIVMEIVGNLHEKLEEVKPGEKGGGEDDMEEAFKGEAVRINLRTFPNVDLDIDVPDPPTASQPP